LPPLPGLHSVELPEAKAPFMFPASEFEVLRRLEKFFSGPLRAYAEGRNRMDMEGTSALSPYLRFGLVSGRSAAAAAHREKRCA